VKESLVDPIPSSETTASCNGVIVQEVAPVIPPNAVFKWQRNKRPKLGTVRRQSSFRATMPLRHDNESTNSASSISDQSHPVTETKPSFKTPPNFKVRGMTMKDIDPVYRLGLVIFTAKEFPNMYRTWDDFTVIENYEASREFCFVAEHVTKDNQTILIGFLLGESMTKMNCGTRGYIQWVGILPRFRRFGIATAMIEAYKSVSKDEGISSLLADTPSDNIPAINMFRKAGLSSLTDHVYLTKKLNKQDGITAKKKHRVSEDGEINFSFSVVGRHSKNGKKHHFTVRTMDIQDLHSVYNLGEQIFTTANLNLYNFWDEDVVLQHYLSDPEFCIVATEKEVTSSSHHGKNHDKDHDNNDEDGSSSTSSDSETRDKVVGFAFGNTIEKPRSSWKYGYLVWLGCAPDRQGMGLATHLYDVMVEIFAEEKVRMLMIDTQQNNIGALKFFRKLGFGHDEEHVYLCSTSGNSPSPVKNVCLPQDAHSDLLQEQQENAGEDKK
jgi:ribosomal protein S18 acetylase RimI-like enzyme